MISKVIAGAATAASPIDVERAAGSSPVTPVRFLGVPIAERRLKIPRYTIADCIQLRPDCLAR